MIKGKRGELTSSQIIGLVLAIAGFVVVLILLFSLSLDEQSDDEVCRLSVLTRATAPSSAQNFVPLKCTTDKICLSKDGGGECEQFAGEKNVEVVKLKGKDSEMAEKIEEVSANAKFDCWSMLGEGKLDLFGNFWKEIGLSSALHEATCVICSRVAIDADSFSDKCGKDDYDKEECEKALEPVLSKVDINEYMENNNVPGRDRTYAYLFSGGSSSRLVRVDDSEVDEETVENDFKASKYGSKFLDAALKDDKEKLKLERAYLFSQVKVGGALESSKKTALLGGGLLAGAFTTPILRKAVANPYALGTALLVIAGSATYAGFNTAAAQEAAAGYCGSLQSSVTGSNPKKDGGKIGCSLVQGVDYDFRKINAICPSIQGSP